jgi:hypothetical protein
MKSNSIKKNSFHFKIKSKLFLKKNIHLKIYLNKIHNKNLNGLLKNFLKKKKSTPIIKMLFTILQNQITLLKFKSPTFKLKIKNCWKIFLRLIKIIFNLARKTLQKLINL